MIMKFQTVRWVGNADGQLELIDQTRLPGEVEYLVCKDVKSLWEAIKRLVVRGAPAIGVAAAYGVVLGLGEVADEAAVEEGRAKVKETAEYLATSRPTAVNLFWALERMKKAAGQSRAGSTGELKEVLLAEAHAIRNEDAAMCRAIGRHGARLIGEGAGVLTHCNAGGLATAEFGTALAVMYSAQEEGRKFRVYADETRPLLQGSRLTAWELMQAGIDVTLICDSMAGYLMSLGKIDVIITGADRIAANGDTANKIGTYSLARLAQAHGIPFYVAAPSSTFDLSIADGAAIPIEERAAEEITNAWNRPTAPANVAVFNPAFDVTPHEYITAIITERGVIEKPDTQAIARHLQNRS